MTLRTTSGLLQGWLDIGAMVILSLLYFLCALVRIKNKKKTPVCVPRTGIISFLKELVRETRTTEETGFKSIA